MSFDMFLAIVAVTNLVSAAVCGLIASRTGRDPFVWLLYGAVLGPVGFIVLLGALSRKNGP